MQFTAAQWLWTGENIPVNKIGQRIVKNPLVTEPIGFGWKKSAFQTRNCFKASYLYCPFMHCVLSTRAKGIVTYRSHITKTCEITVRKPRSSDFSYILQMTGRHITNTATGVWPSHFDKLRSHISSMNILSCRTKIDIQHAQTQFYAHKPMNGTPFKNTVQLEAKSHAHMHDESSILSASCQCTTNTPSILILFTVTVKWRLKTQNKSSLMLLRGVVTVTVAILMSKYDLPWLTNDNKFNRNKVNRLLNQWGIQLTQKFHTN